jgi:hypothetical protein
MGTVSESILMKDNETRKAVIGFLQVLAVILVLAIIQRIVTGKWGTVDCGGSMVICDYKNVK